MAYTNAKALGKCLFVVRRHGDGENIVMNSLEMNNYFSVPPSI